MALRTSSRLTFGMRGAPSVLGDLQAGPQPFAKQLEVGRSRLREPTQHQQERSGKVFPQAGHDDLGARRMGLEPPMDRRGRLALVVVKRWLFHATRPTPGG